MPHSPHQSAVYNQKGWASHLLRAIFRRKLGGLSLREKIPNSNQGCAQMVAAPCPTHDTHDTPPPRTITSQNTDHTCPPHHDHDPPHTTHAMGACCVIKPTDIMIPTSKLDEIDGRKCEIAMTWKNYRGASQTETNYCERDVRKQLLLPGGNNSFVGTLGEATKD